MARPLPTDTSFAALARPRYWPAWLGFGLMRLISLLPLPAIWLLGVAVGTLLYVLHAGRRRVVRRNLERCFPQLPAREREQLVRRQFRAFGQTLFDLGVAWWASRRRIERLVRFRHREHYDRALARGENAILLTPHFLGLEIAGIRLSLERPMVTVFRHPDSVPMRVAMERGRSRFGLKLIEHNRPFTSLVRAVKAGAPLYYLPDQDAGRRHSVFAPFFGIPAATFTVPARLARMTGATVIVCVARQLPFGRGYEVEFQPPLKNFPSGDALTDATRINAAIEKAVRQSPAQYFWMHKRFKTRPEGEKGFYS
jgi:KDO2-lipid IV(A) lauroyltransferase